MASNDLQKQSLNQVILKTPLMVRLKLKQTWKHQQNTKLKLMLKTHCQLLVILYNMKPIILSSQVLALYAFMWEKRWMLEKVHKAN